MFTHFDSSHRPTASQGIALIAHADPVSRQLYGRILRQAGFDTAFASDRAELLTVTTRTEAPKIVVGFTYNLSREGLYVKSYDPPAKDSDLWLELRPPNEPIGVHLRGRVMFTRKPDPTAAASAPPGFGLRIEADACPSGDVVRYKAAYEELSANPPSAAA